MAVKRWLSTWVVIWGAHSLICLSVGKPSDPQPVKTYDVDLDAPPEERWKQVLEDHKEYLPAILDMVRGYVPEEFLPLVQQIADQIEDIIPSPFAQEIKGGSAYLGLKLGDAVLMNILYDLTAYCTSIVAQDTNGTIWHGRNLDYSNADLLRNLTINVNFRRKNETVYSAVTYAGYVGILTGQRPFNWTISVDQRGDKDRHDGPFWLNELTAILNKNSSFVTFLIRQMLEAEPNFDEAVNNLSLTVVHAPVYLIIAGTKQGEGVLITRDRTAALDRRYLSPVTGRWYLLETNYDWWGPAPPNDSQRRAVGIASMDKLGASHVNATALYNVLSTRPVLANGTTYTTIMSAAHPEVFNTHVRWP